MEDDACFQDVDAHELPVAVRGGFAFGCLEVSVAEVFDQERDEESRHGDGRCRGLVGQRSEAFIAKHELGVGEKLRGFGLLAGGRFASEECGFPRDTAA